MASKSRNKHWYCLLCGVRKKRKTFQRSQPGKKKRWPEKNENRNDFYKPTPPSPPQAVHNAQIQMETTALVGSSPNHAARPTPPMRHSPQPPTASAVVATVSPVQLNHHHQAGAASSSPSDLHLSSSTTTATRTTPVPSAAISPTPLLSTQQLERSIKIKKAGLELGLTVEGAEKPGSYCQVRSVTPSGAVASDGRIGVGDYIVSVNHESFRSITASQARAILRRADLIATDVSVTYIPASDVLAHAESSQLRMRDQQTPPTSQLSPNPSLQQPALSNSIGATSGGDAGSTHTPPTDVLRISPIPDQMMSSPGAQSSSSSAHQPQRRAVSPMSVASSWGTPRTVHIQRHDHESLGISIVGGRVDLFNVSQETQRSISGIFIKHVLENSPAGRNGTLQTGDRILEVDGVNLREATHDKAVDAIKKARSPVTFLVQSLVAEQLDEEMTTEAPCDPPVQTSVPLPLKGEDEFGNSWEKVVKAYGELTGDLHLVAVERGSNGLGLSLAGDRSLDCMSVFVAGIKPNSCTAQDGRIRVGDQLLEANGHVIYGRCHLNASAIIKGLDAKQVKLLLLRRNDYLTHMAVPPLSNRPEEYKEDPNTFIPKNIPLEHQTSITSVDSDISLSQDINANQSATTVKAEQTQATSSQQPAEEPVNEEPASEPLANSSHKTVILQRGSQGLGFAIQLGNSSGEDGIFIKTISPNSPAAESGELQVGDQIVLVQNNSLVGVTYDRAIELIRSCRGTVNLTINQRTDISQAPPTVEAINQNSSRNASISTPANQTADNATTNQCFAPDNNQLPADANQVLPHQSNPESVPESMQEETKSDETSTEAKPEDLKSKEDSSLPKEKADSVNNNKSSNETEKTAAETDCAPPANDNSSLPPPPAEDVVFEEPVDEDPGTVTITPGRETVIEIQKGRSGLGLSIVGGADTMLGAIIIHEVYEDGAAAKDGRLWAGDQIIEVNGECLRDATHERAIQVLRQTPAVVRMIVFRDETALKDEDIYDIFTVDLMKKPGKGLGLSIVGRRNDTGVFISDIVKGGVADSCGNLRQGDQILKVNDEDLKSAAQEHAAALLKTLMGKVSLSIGRLKGSSSSSSRRNSSQTGSDRAMKKSESSASNLKGKNKHSKTFSNSSSLSGGGVGGGGGGGPTTPVMREVTVARDSSGSLGLSIAGGRGSALGDVPIIVASLSPHGAAALCGEIREGDHILSINGASTANVTHQEAVQMLRSTQAITTLQLIQGEDMTLTNGGQEESDSDLDTSSEQKKVRLVRLERGAEGLGFTIVGGHNSAHGGNMPIYIQTVSQTGAAAKSGALKRGDQLLAVNGQSLEGATHQQAAETLKNATGLVKLKVLS